MTTHEPLRLNLGAGDCPLPGFVNLDRKYPMPPRNTGTSTEMHQADVWPLHYPDDCADEVRASHVLEHFSHTETLEVLQEWVRVLRPGGVLKLAVPDFMKIAKWFIEGSDLPLEGYLMGGHVDADDYHKAIFDADGLRRLMDDAGLVEVQPWASEIQDCADLPVSLNLMGRKITEAEEQAEQELRDWEKHGTAPAPEKLPGVVCVMTAPRLGFTDTFHSIFAALSPLGITWELGGGVFWCQSLSNLFERHLNDGTKYLLTVDYDTVFDRSDVLQLHRLMEAHPQIGALCALQMRRDQESPLFCVGDRPKSEAGEERTVEIAADQLTLPITTGHFGLTLIRVDSLRCVPMPWFVGVPDNRGGWGAARMDPDIHFWHAWKKAGNALHVALRVPVGHLQMVVSWPGPQLNSVSQWVSNYNHAGKPPGLFLSE